MNTNNIHKNKYFRFFTVCFFALVMFIFLVTPGRNFPTGTTFNIEKGSGLKKISSQLKNENIIKSKFIFEAFVIIQGGENNIVYGDYLFSKKTNLFVVVNRILRGVHEVAAVRVTIPEGYTNREIADEMSVSLRNFDTEKFLALAKDKEGYLFPDTYFFFPTTDEAEVVRVMNQTFDKKIAGLSEQIKKSGHSLKEIITMASLVEKEATKANDRRMISGILWNRIRIGMPLQVDAVFVYLLGKGSSELSIDDLKYNSPYNTYRNKGLPPGPIGSPGIDSIEAALNPLKSSHLYYLHDKNGIIHYATNFEGHVSNKRKYLR